jgi:hypothetical protein
MARVTSGKRESGNVKRWAKGREGIEFGAVRLPRRARARRVKFTSQSRVRESEGLRKYIRPVNERDCPNGTTRY